MSARRPRRWPWLLSAGAICLAALAVLLLLQAREREARANEAAARTFAAQLLIGRQDPEISTVLMREVQEHPRELDALLRRRVERLLGQVRTIERIDGTRGKAIRRQLIEVRRQPPNAIVASGLGFLRASRVAAEVAAEQRSTAARAERDSLIGSMGSLLLATVLVAALLGRDRRAAIAAAHVQAASLQRLADTDVLTGLLNRRRFDADLARLSQQGRRQIEIAICDINGLKAINDRLGHHAGDAVLTTATQDLTRAVGDAGTVYRTGGDEFTVISSPGVRVADRVRAAFEHGGAIMASVGAASWPTDGELPRNVVRLADDRMYDAKRALARAA